MQSWSFIGSTASTARSTSSSVAPPVERIIGLPIAATCRSSGVLRRSPEAILNAGTSSSASRSALAAVERRGEERDARAPRRRPAAPRTRRGRARAPRGARRRSGQSCSRCRTACRTRAREQGAVVALLQLDGVDAAVLARAEQLLRLLEAPWWLWPISAITKQSPSSRDPSAVEDELSHVVSLFAAGCTVACDGTRGDDRRDSYATPMSDGGRAQLQLRVLEDLEGARELQRLGRRADVPLPR